MAEISKELNSILNENKNPVEVNHSPLNFILLLIFAVISVYFAVMYFNIRNEKTNSNDTQKYEKIIKENIILNEENKRIKKEFNKLKTKKQVIKIVEEKTETKSFKQLYFSDNTKALKCYGYKSATTAIPNICFNKFKDFLNENQKALRFQVIPVLSSKDIKAFEKFDKNTQELLLNGVSVKRVSEVLWKIKKSSRK